MSTQRYTIMMMVFELLCLFALLGCDASDKADAQDDGDDQLIRTFVIDPTTFVLETDAVPTVDVSANATFYTLLSDGTIRFTEVATGDANVFDLDNGDRVVERPASGKVTVVRDRP